MWSGATTDLLTVRTLTQSLGIIVLLNRLRYYSTMLQCYQTMYSRRGTCIQLFTSAIGNRCTYPVIYRYNGKQIHVYPIHRYNSTQVHIYTYLQIQQHSGTRIVIYRHNEKQLHVYIYYSTMRNRYMYTLIYIYNRIHLFTNTNTIAPLYCLSQKINNWKKGNKSSDKRHILLQQTINSIKVGLTLFHLGFSGSLQDQGGGTKCPTPITFDCVINS